MITGLSKTKAANQLKSHGYNELPSSKPKNILRIALEVMREPMFILLISCGILYMLLGDYTEGIILLSTNLIIIFITFYQYQKTEKALDALRQLSSPRALVIRDGEEIRVPGREVVPGDVILLHEGDRIPADSQIIEALNLIVDESLLTGESVPVQKHYTANTTDPLGLVFSGTLVVQGKGKALVTATGISTHFGKIGSSLQSIEEEETRLQKEMKVLIKNLFIIGAVLSIGVILASYFTRGALIQSILNGLAAAMAILPEEFPVVLTVFMALGAWRLSKNQVLTRKPTAIETLGSATVLCSDKTGTITQNKMEIAAVFTEGKWVNKEDFLAEKNIVAPLITTAHFASQKDSIDPMEKAISKVDSQLTTEPLHYTFIKEYPLSKALFAMTRVVEVHDTKELLISCKGAPETIIELCNLNATLKETVLNTVGEMASKGYRVIAVAKVAIPSGTLPETQQEFTFEYMGLLGFEDPIRPEVPQAIQECHDAGIQVIMITGDYPATAMSIAQQIGMKLKEILTGEMLDKLSDSELQEKIKNVSVFARVVPEQKLRIVQALKANKEIVAMTGDGVNDAPALKAAHIGIAMGNKGTDVAREASSLVLLDDNFASIVSAIRLGRKIFDNLQKAMSYIIAIHIPIIGLTLLPSFFAALPLLLTPVHIVFMELIIDPVCSVAFESEQEERNIMKRAPRNPREHFFGGKHILFSVLQGILLLLMVLGIYFLSLKEGHTTGEVRAITFSSLIVGNVYLILTNLSKTRSAVAVLTEKNIALWIILGLATTLLFCIISVPALQRIFSFEFPGYQHFITALVGATLLLLILEGKKFYDLRRK